MAIPLTLHGVRLAIQDGTGGPAREEDFPGPVLQVGRGSGNDISFADPRVSSLHGRLLCDGERLLYQDLGSTNGSALLRGRNRTAVSKDLRPGLELQPGDEILLGDAERPSSIRVLELLRAEAEAGREATVVAHQALGSMPGQAAGEAFGKLLVLLAKLRTESDTLSLTRQVLEFLVATLPGASRAECFMKDATGHFAPVLVASASPARVVGTPPSATLIARMVDSREALLVEDTALLPDASRSIRTLSARSLLLAPLVSDEQVVGAIQVGAQEGGRFGERDLGLVAVLAQQLSALLSGARLIERLRETEAQLRGERDYLRGKLSEPAALEAMIGNSAALAEVRRQILAVAPSRTTVLVLGETGSGKELVARAIHEQSPRAAAAFAAVNCSALARGVLESELFGHVRGAFTGAHRDHQGLFEVANGGTLLLDEVGDFPLDLQPKLLRALEEGTVLPVGSSKPKKVDVRVIAATHRPLDQDVATGRFRQDLLFRLNVFTLRVPPLRARPEDILVLAEHFLGRFSREHDRPHPGFTADAIAAIQGHDWPGNIRELKNEMERASLLAPAGEAADRVHLSERLSGGDPIAQVPEGTLHDTMARLEALVVGNALKRHGGNRTQCAKALGISRQALIAKIARLGLGSAEE